MWYVPKSYLKCCPSGTNCHLTHTTTHIRGGCRIFKKWLQVTPVIQNAGGGGGQPRIQHRLGGGRPPPPFIRNAALWDQLPPPPPPLHSPRTITRACTNQDINHRTASSPPSYFSYLTRSRLHPPPPRFSYQA